MEGNRIFNSLFYEKFSDIQLDELKKSSSFAQIHPEDVDRVRQAGEEARRSGIGGPSNIGVRHKDGSWRCWNPRQV